MAIKNSTSVLVLIDATAVANSLDASVSINREAVNITTKDSGIYEEFFAGAVNATVTISGLYEDGETDSIYSLISGTGTASEATIKFGNAVSGEEYWEATGVCTSLEIGSPGYQQAMTYNATFQLSGTITKADNV